MTNDVIESAAPKTYAAEFRFQSSLVARKIALRICGPAIITNAIGRMVRKLTRPPPYVRTGRLSRRTSPSPPSARAP